jgi:hypothetical protein
MPLLMEPLIDRGPVPNPPGGMIPFGPPKYVDPYPAARRRRSGGFCLSFQG